MRRSTLLWALALLNAVLLVALTAKLGGENTAQAQARGRGDYVMIPARMTHAPNGVMYIIDTRNGLLSGFAFDSNRGDLAAMPPINLGRVFAAGGGPPR
jgi:hypothetical protein